MAARALMRWSFQRTALVILSLFGLIAVGLFLWPDAARATSITVNTELDPAPDPATGRYPIDGKCSLRAAIQAAQSNSNAHDTDCATGLGGGVLDTIHIDASLAGKVLTMTYARPFEAISGPDNPLEIVGPTTSSAGFTINGNNATRIFHVGYANIGTTDFRGVLRLANLTIRGGNGHQNVSPPTYAAADGDGGAMFLGNASQLTLDNVVLRDNTVTGSSRGAAIYAVAATITNNGGAYINNAAAGNGGTGSGGGRGGAVFMEEGPSALNGYAVLFDGNAAAYAGGAVATNPGASSALVHLERSLAKSNTAQVGGVMYIDSSRPGTVLELTDSTITGNSASQSGGVFFSQATTQTFSFLRDTFVNNTGSGGLFRAGGGTLANSIVVDSGCENTGGGPGFTSIRTLMGGTNTGCAFIDSIGAVTGLSATLAQNGGPEIQQTFALASTSNAVDNGDPAYCGIIDARSIPRGINGAGAVNSPMTGDCDIGAYEYAGYIVNFVTGTSSVTEGQARNVQVRLAIPDPSLRPLASPLTVNVARNAGSTARYPIDFTMGTGTVVFPAGSTDGAIASALITTVQDDIAERNGEFVLFDLSGSGVSVAEPRQHELSIQDDDQAGFVKNDGGNGTTVSEATPGTTDSFTIALRSQPDYSQPDPNDSNSYGPLADVVAHIEPDRDCDVTVGGSTARLGQPVDLTILNANWGTGYSLTVTAIDDLYDEDFRVETTPHKCTITFSFTSGDPVYNATTDSYEPDVIDNDVAGVTIVAAGGTSIVEAGITDTYTVVLDTPPDPGDPLPSIARSPTIVVADPDLQCDTGAGRGVATNVSFTGSNWNVPQTVTVTAYDDPTVELAHSCLIPHTINSPDPVYADLDDAPPFAKTPVTITAAVQDFDPPSITNDPPNVVITSTGGTSVAEATPATADTLSVVLLRQPLNADVTVTLTSSVDPRTPGPGSQLLLQDNLPGTPAAPASSLTLTFTASNWDTPQTVNVLAVNDDFDEADPHSAALNATMASTAPGFNSASLRKFVIDGVESADTGSVPVTIVDNDVSSILVTEAGGTQVTEGGATDTYTFRLGTHPYGDVTVSVTPGAQCNIGFGAGVAQAYAIPHGDWNVPITVTVSALDDRLVEVTTACVITQVASSADVLYDDLAGPSVSASVIDNDPPRVLITTGGGVAVAEATAALTDSYSVVLASQPDADVTVTVTVNDGQTTVSAPSMTFTNANWDIPQIVTVQAVDDRVDDDDPHAGAIVHAVTSTATGFSTAPELWVDGVSATNVTVSIGDDDTAGVTILQSAGATSVAEGGATDTYTVVLDSQPVAGISIGAGANAQCSASGFPLTFDAGNWNTAQIVTVSAVDDVVVEGPHSCALTHAVTSTDPKYDNITVAGVTVDVADDDIPLVTITANGLSVSESVPATTAGYSVVLGAAPLADVTVTATVDDGQTALSADGATTASLTFTPVNWNIAQQVTVWAIDDDVDEADPHLGSITHQVSSTAIGFASAPVIEVNGAAGSAVQVTIADNDTASILVTETGTTEVSEAGATDTYSFHLGTRPLAAVTVLVAPGAQCDVGSGPGTARSFVIAAVDWNVPVVVTVGAVDDRLAEGATNCDITHAASSADPLYQGLAGPSVSAGVVDDDPPRVLITTGGVAVAEANAALADTYSVVLASQPDADVTVTLTVSDGQTAVTTSSLVFTSTNWDQSQVVSVNAIDDEVDETDPHAGTIHHAVVSPATGFATAPEITVDGVPVASVAVSIADNDTAGVTVVETAGTTAVAEGGATDTYTVVLTSQPVGGVSVAVVTDPQCSASPSSLSFAAGTWNTAQTITVSAVDDVVVEGAHGCTLSHTVTSADPNYGGLLAAGISGSVTDNDIPLISITASGLTVSEATPTTTAGYSVVLGAAPMADVTVTATVSDGQTALSAGGATEASLTFTPSNWNVAQPVTVWVVDDLVRELNPHNGTVGHTVSSTAPGFASSAVVQVNGQAGSDVTVAITDNDVPDLALTVSDGGMSGTPGNLVTYTLNWSNLAGGVPALGTILTETVPANTTFVASSSGTWSCADGSPAGTTCTQTVGTVAGGGSGTTTFTVRLVTPAPSGLTSITNTASIADDGTNGPDPNSANNAGSDTTPVDAAPDLRIIVSDGAATVVPGGTTNTVVYTLTYSNAGNQDATGVVLTNVVPANSTFLLARSTGAWSCANASPAGTVCTIAIGNLPAGAGASERFAVKAANTVPAGVDALSDTATVADDGTNGPDSVPGDNSSTDTTPVIAAPDLVIVTDDGGANAVANGTITYQLRYSNAGNQGATGAVIREVVPANTRFNAAGSSAGWSCADASPAGTECTLSIGDLAAGANGVARFAVTVNSPLPSGVKEVTNTSSISDDGTNGADRNPANNTSTDKAAVKKK